MKELFVINSPTHLDYHSLKKLIKIKCILTKTTLAEFSVIEMVSAISKDVHNYHYYVYPRFNTTEISI